MALYITEQPARLNFARNSILFKVRTDRVLNNDESMLRIVCKARFYLDSSVTYTGDREYTVELSMPVANNGEAVFNLRDQSQTLLDRLMPMDMSSSENPLGENGECVFYEVYVKDGDEVCGFETSVQPFKVIPGGRTDYELIKSGIPDFDKLLKNVRRMSRKPDAGIVYKGEVVVLPVLVDRDLACYGNIQIGGAEVTSFTNEIFADKTCILHSSVNYSQDGEMTVTWRDAVVPFKGYYRANSDGVHFLRFINGFGAVENISVRVKDKLSYEVSGETHSLLQGDTISYTDRRYATKSQPVGVYELSSGYVSQKWAEWYVQELLTSPRVWIQLGGKWIPALIEAEDDCVIYDRTKPEMPHVDFTLRLAVDGVTGITW